MTGKIHQKTLFLFGHISTSKFADAAISVDRQSVVDLAVQTQVMNKNAIRLAEGNRFQAKTTKPIRARYKATNTRSHVRGNAPLNISDATR